MSTSLLSLPVRLGARSAGLALRTTSSVTGQALGLVGTVIDAVARPARPAKPAVDLDGEPLHRARRAQSPVPTPPAPDPGPPPPGPDPVPMPPGPDPSPPTPPPAPEPPASPHISTEPELVAETADPGAEDGAGAEVRVAEPWDGYRQLQAADVIDRITGADPAQLAAIELYELSGRRRQTVLDAVERELERTRRGGQ